jgi:molybdopterin-guanine dinucleotide biosynthesis protein A
MTLPVRGEALGLRVLGVLAEAGLDPLAVAASPGQLLPELPGGIAVLRDRAAGRGPLQALVDGLAELGARGAEIVFAAACDLPLLTPAFVRSVVAGLGERRGLVPLDDEGRAHVLAAAYRVDLEPALRDLLRAGRREVRALLGLPGIATMEAGARELFNLNRPADLRRLEDLLADGA